MGIFIFQIIKENVKNLGKKIVMAFLIHHIENAFLSDQFYQFFHYCCHFIYFFPKKKFSLKAVDVFFFEIWRDIQTDYTLAAQEKRKKLKEMSIFSFGSWWTPYKTNSLVGKHSTITKMAKITKKTFEEPENKIHHSTNWPFSKPINRNSTNIRMEDIKVHKSHTKGFKYSYNFAYSLTTLTLKTFYILFRSFRFAWI